MGSGTRARARAIKPRDNLHVEEAHRVSSSPPGEHPAEARLGSSPTRREVDESRLEARADSGAGTSPSSPLARSAHYLELHAERRRRALEADTDVAQPSEPSEPGAQPPRRGADVPGDADILLYVEDDRREHIDRHVSAPSDPTPRNPDTTGRTAAGPAHPGLGNVACDACPSCDDRCLVPSCVTCGGASARRTASTEDIERASTSEGITAEMAAEAAAAAAAAAANPRRNGWGRVAGEHGGGGAAGYGASRAAWWRGTGVRKVCGWWPTDTCTTPLCSCTIIRWDPCPCFAARGEITRRTWRCTAAPRSTRGKN